MLFWKMRTRGKSGETWQMIMARGYADKNQGVPQAPAKKGTHGLQTAPSVNVYHSPEPLQSQNQPT